jgi:hypothetical protein
MTELHEETDVEFNAFLAGVDSALTETFGPNHQEVLGCAGSIVSQFEGWGGLGLKRLDLPS